MGVVKKQCLILVLSCIISCVYFAFLAKGFYESQVIPYGVVYYPLGTLFVASPLLVLQKCYSYFSKNHEVSLLGTFFITFLSLILSSLFMKNIVGGFIARNYVGGLEQFYRVGYTNLFQLPLYMEDCKYTDWILHEDEQGYFYYDKRGNRKEATGIVSFEVDTDNHSDEISENDDKIEVYDTEKGFTVKYPLKDARVVTTNTCEGGYFIPWVSADKSNLEFQVTRKQEFDETIGIHIESDKSGNIIRFLSYEGSKPIPSEEFFYPSELERLQRNGKELEYSEQTISLNNKTFVRGTTRYSKGAAVERKNSGLDYVATQYHYTENGKSYVMYSLTNRGDPEDIVIETMEFMCFTLEVTD